MGVGSGAFVVLNVYRSANLLIMSTRPSLCLRRLTGFQVPPPVTSTGNVFSLRLTSDFAVSAHGFKLNYEGQRVSLCVCTKGPRLSADLCSSGKREQCMREPL